MSHTIEADGATLTGNSDFSGDVAIGYIDSAGHRVGVLIPGHVFLALAKRAVGRQMFYAVESAIDDWIGESEEGTANPRPTHGGGTGT